MLDAAAAAVSVAAAALCDSYGSRMRSSSSIAFHTGIGSCKQQQQQQRRHVEQHVGRSASNFTVLQAYDNDIRQLAAAVFQHSAIGCVVLSHLSCPAYPCRHCEFEISTVPALLLVLHAVQRFPLIFCWTT
jgi:hypothetical protein